MKEPGTYWASDAWSCALSVFDFYGRTGMISVCQSRKWIFPGAIQSEIEAVWEAVESGASEFEDLLERIFAKRGEKMRDRIRRREREGMVVHADTFADKLSHVEAEALAERLPKLAEELRDRSSLRSPVPLSQIIEDELGESLRFSATSNDLELSTVGDILSRCRLRWIVPDLIPRAGLVAIYGPWSCGKSFLALDLTLSIACGMPFFGTPTVQGKACYVLAEGVEGFGARIAAWSAVRQAFPDTVSENFRVVPRAVRFFDGQSVELRMLLERAGFRPVVVVLDTLNGMFSGGDENRTEDMTRFLGYVEDLRNSLDATIIIVHHSRADGERIRGSGALPARMDTIIRCQAQGGAMPREKILEATVEKQKGKDERWRIRAKILEEPESQAGYLREVPWSEVSAQDEATESGLLEALLNQWIGVPISERSWRASYHPVNGDFGSLVKQLVTGGWVKLSDRRLGNSNNYEPTEKALSAKRLPF